MEHETIRYGLGKSSIGQLVVGFSRKGVVAILIGDDRDALIDELQHRFPKAELTHATAADAKLVKQISGYIEKPARGLKLPLDMRGTKFQQNVWRALRRVPMGKIVTFADIARRIGAPRSSRAVGNACLGNPLPLAVPCHRVVRNKPVTTDDPA